MKILDKAIKLCDECPEGMTCDAYPYKLQIQYTNGQTEAQLCRSESEAQKMKEKYSKKHGIKALKVVKNSDAKLNKAVKLCDETYKGYTIKPLEGRKGISMHGAVGAYKNSKLEFTADNVKELKKEIDALDPPIETTFTFRAMVEHNGVPSYRRISVVSTSREEARKKAEKLKYKEEKIVD